MSQEGSQNASDGQTIPVSDTQMLKELAKIGKSLGGTFSKAAKDDDKKSSGLKDMMSGGLGKLGMITLGVGTIMGVAKLFIGASPMLKSMLKLFQFGIMLVLRPIGDFIGFMLRPIMLMVLTKFILPFYQNALPMLQEAGTLLGETIVPWIEKLFLGIVGAGQMIVGALTFNGDMYKEGEKNWATALSLETDKQVDAVHNVATVVETLDANNTAGLNSIKTGWGDLPKLRDAVKPDLTSMNKFSSSELIKMMGLLGDKTNVAGVGAANTAVNVGAARGDVTTLKEMKDLWYKTLMSEGGWTKMPDGKTFGQTSVSEPQVIEINVNGMNGNYTPSEKYEFEYMVKEAVAKEMAKRPR